MISLPRLALATSSRGPEPAVASLALMAGLAERRWRVQHFRARACPFGMEVVGQVTGLPGRHLDSWLMPPEVCRQVFARGACRATLALVEGTLDEQDVPAPLDCVMRDRPGPLAPLAEVLDLPTVAVVSCSGVDRLHLTALPPSVDALILDGLEDRDDYETVREVVSMFLKRPVLGAVEALPEIRAALRQLPQGLAPPPDLIEPLAASFLRFADLPALRALAECRPFPLPHDQPCRGLRRRFRVAYAMDEAFGRYFPDTLETLETLGAVLSEFSPLRDERLPDDVDLVMIGCGFPDQHAEALAENHCLITALRGHVCKGRRIYAEGGGAAYLGRHLILPGRRVRGAGILPFDAELVEDPLPPSPVERVLTRDGWLGPSGTTVRGYQSGRWRLSPAPDPGDGPVRSGPLTEQRDIYSRHHAVGSLIHLHLAALPQVVAAFAGPHAPSLSLPQSRS